MRLEDDSTRIFLNTHGTNSEGVRPELIDLLHYMEHTNEKSLSFANDKLSALQQNVKSVQENAEIGVRYMQLWEEFVDEKVVPGGNAMELYFEDNDLDAFAEKLEASPYEIQYVNRLMEHDWGQRVIRFYDPDMHLIEVGESLEYVARK